MLQRKIQLAEGAFLVAFLDSRFPAFFLLLSASRALVLIGWRISRQPTLQYLINSSAHPQNLRLARAQSVACIWWRSWSALARSVHKFHNNKYINTDLQQMVTCLYFCSSDWRLLESMERSRGCFVKDIAEGMGYCIQENRQYIVSDSTWVVCSLTMCSRPDASQGISTWMSYICSTVSWPIPPRGFAPFVCLNRSPTVGLITFPVFSVKAFVGALESFRCGQDLGGLLLFPKHLRIISASSKVMAMSQACRPSHVDREQCLQLCVQ